MANYELIFIRHGEHKGGDCIIPELTADGVAEAKKIGNELSINRFDDFVAFAVNSPRYIGTVALVMLPSLDVSEVENISEQLIQEKRL